MNVLFTVSLDNRHVRDGELLAALVRQAVRDFNTQTRGLADLRHVRFVTDEFLDRSLRLSRSDEAALKGAPAVR